MTVRASAPAAVRAVFSDGEVWTVTERRLGGDRSLVFATTAKIRRVRHYPARWRELSPVDLERLSWQT
jgi:hypothetical protein